MKNLDGKKVERRTENMDFDYIFTSFKRPADRCLVEACDRN